MDCSYKQRTKIKPSLCNIYILKSHKLKKKHFLYCLTVNNRALLGTRGKTHSHTLSHTYGCAHTCTLTTRACPHTRKRIHIHANTSHRTHSRADTRTRVRGQTRPHKRTHARTHKRTHMLYKIIKSLKQGKIVNNQRIFRCINLLNSVSLRKNLLSFVNKKNITLLPQHLL